MAVDYFSELGTKTDPKLRTRNAEIRSFLKKNKKYTPKTKRGKRLRKELKTNFAKANPIDAATGQRLRGMEGAASAAARQKYGTTRQSYTDQIATANQQLANLDPYFQQYQSHVLAVGQNAANVAQAQAQQAVATNTQATQQAQSGTNAIAARAEGNPQAQEGLQAAQSATAGRAALVQNSANAMVERGNIRKDMAGAQAANTNLAKEETRGKINSNVKKITQGRNELDQVIGDYFKGNLDDQRSSFMDNKLKEAALELNNIKTSAALENTAADNARADRTLANQEAKTQREQENVANGLNPNGTPIKQPAGAAPKPKFTQANKNTAKQTYKGGRDTALRWIKNNKLISQSKINENAKRGVNVKGVKPNVEQRIKQIADDMGGTKYQALARAAVMDAIYGGVDAKTRKRIQEDYGITLRLSRSAKKKK